MNLVKVKIKKMKYIQLIRKCRTFLVEMSLICLKIKHYFHVSGFALILALIHRGFFPSIYGSRASEIRCLKGVGDKLLLNFGAKFV